MQDETEKFTIDEILSAGEAEKLYGLPVGAIRQSCTRGRLKRYVGTGHVRKSGGVWLVSKKVMSDLYSDARS